MKKNDAVMRKQRGRLRKNVRKRRRSVRKMKQNDAVMRKQRRRLRKNVRKKRKQSDDVMRKQRRLLRENVRKKMKQIARRESKCGCCKKTAGRRGSEA
jgi:hypothetical protein